MTKVQAVFFDLFETLITEYAGGVRKVRRAADPERRSRIGLTEREFRQEWNARIGRRMTGAFPDYPAVLREICTHRGLEYTEETLQRMLEERVAEKAAAFREIGNDIVQMLCRLKDRGIRLGLISNCTAEEVTAWAGSPLAPYFETVLFSYETGLAKPDPGIYALGCSRLGVMPRDCLFVGDGGSHELDGAKEAGMTALQAAWYVPEAMAARIQGYERLKEPAKLLDWTT
ncbi:putative hydrolase of the HAD superfamily [Paenibacillus mucilaginosus]|uniref:HAD family hydrolase n=1 Tax=Paenibacillus mucilaginosus TaxID=61624 RepID=UPI003D200C8E